VIPRAIFALVFLAVSGVAPRVFGDDAVSLAIDTERFRPTADPEGGLLLSGVSIGSPWQIDFAAWVHASRNPIVRTSGDGVGRGEALVEGRVGARLQAGLNIGKRVRLAVDLPLTLYQGGVHPVTDEALPTGGLGDVRLEPRVMILDPRVRPLGVAFAAPISFPTGREDALIGDLGPTIQPRVTLEVRPASKEVRRLSFAIAGDFGWRFRPQTQLAGVDTAGEFTFSVGGRWTPSAVFRVGTELAAAIGAANNSRHAEWVSWARVALGSKKRIDVLGGVALGLGPGVGTPEGRVFFGIRTRIDPRVRTDAVVVEAPRAEVSEEAVVVSRPPVPGYSSSSGGGLRLVGRPARIRSRVLFGLDSARLTETGRSDLERLGRWLTSHPSVRRVEVGGHADRRGEHAHNDPLSRRRAKAVVNFLVLRGVGAERLLAKGYGERKPTGDDHVADRRVEFLVLDGDAAGFADVVAPGEEDRLYRSLRRSRRDQTRR
jgi:outer membrane protein OmpA-like peptidoglycan-associated protein